MNRNVVKADLLGQQNNSQNDDQGEISAVDTRNICHHPSENNCSRAMRTMRRKGRILMLHGWAQNARVFANRTKTLTKKFNQAGYDCIFLQAPHVLPPLCRSKNENNNDNNAPSTTTSTTNIGRSDARAWFWYNANDPSDIRASQSGEPLVYHGLEASLAIVERELVANQQPQQPQFTPWPFTAILGFSQGAVLGHILAHLAAKGRPLCFANINAVILMSGFAAQHDVCHAQSTHEHSHDTSGLRERMVASITLPSLHVIGRNDSSVAPSASCDLAHAFFVEPQILWHDKGHVIPQQQAHVSTMIDFLNVCEKTTKSMET